MGFDSNKIPKAFFALFFSLPLLGQTMKGECPSTQHWVRPHHRRGYFRATGSYVKATEVTGHCAQNPSGYEAWRNKLNDGRPKNWLPKIERSKKWTDEEIERVLEALDSLPEKLRNQLVGSIYRMGSSIFGDNPGQERDGNVILYNSAFEEKYNLARILAHEISHNWYEHLSDDEKKSYLEAAQWKMRRDGRGEVGRSNETFVSKDGRKSPGEDFSDNIEYYLFNPEKLKNTTPTVYQWIQGHYGQWLRLNEGNR